MTDTIFSLAKKIKKTYKSKSIFLKNDKKITSKDHKASFITENNESGVAGMAAFFAVISSTVCSLSAGIYFLIDTNFKEPMLALIGSVFLFVSGFICSFIVLCIFFLACHHLFNLSVKSAYSFTIPGDDSYYLCTISSKKIDFYYHEVYSPSDSLSSVTISTKNFEDHKWKKITDPEISNMLLTYIKKDLIDYLTETSLFLDKKYQHQLSLNQLNEKTKKDQKKEEMIKENLKNSLKEKNQKEIIEQSDEIKEKITKIMTASFEESSEIKNKINELVEVYKKNQQTREIS